MSPGSTNKSPLFRSHDLRPGKIICRPHLDAFVEFFAIVGISNTDVALVRLFEEQEINPVLSAKCTSLLHALTISIPFEKLHFPLYADVTKLFYQQREAILLQLNKGLFVFAGKVHKKDLTEIANALLKCNTISLHEKTTFLTF